MNYAYGIFDGLFGAAFLYLVGTGLWWHECSRFGVSMLLVLFWFLFVNIATGRLDRY